MDAGSDCDRCGGSAGQDRGEAVGEGGALVPDDAAPTAWVDALSAMWDDDSTYGRLCEAAREHAARDDANAQRILDRFIPLVKELVGRVRSG